MRFSVAILTALHAIAVASAAVIDARRRSDSPERRDNNNTLEEREAGVLTARKYHLSPVLLEGFGYATFYDDYDCSVNPGPAIDMHNTYCLKNFVGRHSIYMQVGAGALFRPASLVWSPGPDCNCQNYCTAYEQIVVNSTENNYCWSLKGYPNAMSFRFLREACDKNNCPVQNDD